MREGGKKTFEKKKHIEPIFKKVNEGDEIKKTLAIFLEKGDEIKITFDLF